MPAVVLRAKADEIVESEIGIIFGREVQYDAWAAKMAEIQKRQKGLLWKLGDSAMAGEELFGERYAQAIEHYSAESIQHARRICRAFPHARRRKCGFSFHQAVIALPESDQDELLDLAVKQDWTRQEMREAAKDRAAQNRRGNQPPELVDDDEPLLIEPELELAIDNSARGPLISDNLRPIEEPPLPTSVSEALHILGTIGDWGLLSACQEAVRLMLDDRAHLLKIAISISRYPSMGLTLLPNTRTLLNQIPYPLEVYPPAA
jgi:hypothetical protein